MDKVKAFIVTNQSNIVIALVGAIVFLGYRVFKK